MGSGHAALGLRGDYARQLRLTASELGAARVRFHGVLDDDVGIVAGVDASGAPRLNFTNVDRIFDVVVAAGMDPFVEVRAPRAVLRQYWVQPTHTRDAGDAVRRTASRAAPRRASASRKRLY